MQPIHTQNALKTVLNDDDDEISSSMYNTILFSLIINEQKIK